MPRGRHIGILFLLLSLVLAGLILTDGLPHLRGPAPGTSEWYWPYLLRPFARWWPSILAGIAISLVGGWWLRRDDGRDDSWLLVSLACLSLALQLGLVYADRPHVGAELVDRTLSKASSGYLATAGEIDNLGEALRRYPELMPTFDNDHARTHPPGFIIAHWLTDHVLRRFPRLTEALARPATYWRCTDLWVLARPPSTAAALWLWSWLPPLLAALTVIPAYALSRRWYEPKIARLAALLAATLPALLLFVPTPDQIFAFLAALSLFLLISGLRHMRWGAVLTAGLIVSLMSFLSLGNVAWAALLSAYGVWWLLWPGEASEALRQEPRRWGMLLLFGMGAAVLWLFYWAGWGVAPWVVARAGLAQHYELVTSIRRYDWWLFYNLVDLFLFAGPPVAVGLVWRAGAAVRGRREHITEDGRLAILLLALLLAINLAGSTRGEVGRLWLVFMPAAAVVAGGVLGRRLGGWKGMWLLLVAQLILVLSIGLGWRPFYAVILPVERPAIATAAPPTYLDVAFPTPDDREIRLASLNVPRTVAEPGAAIEATLYWRANGPTLRPYTVFLQLLDDSGALIAQVDRWPAAGQWPSTCWVGGETIADPYVLDVPDDIAPGRYRLVTGLYDAGSGGRLVATDGRDAIELAEITIDSQRDPQ